MKERKRERLEREKLKSSEKKSFGKRCHFVEKKIKKLCWKEKEDFTEKIIWGREGTETLMGRKRETKHDFEGENERDFGREKSRKFSEKKIIY